MLGVLFGRRGGSEGFQVLNGIVLDFLETQEGGGRTGPIKAEMS